MVRTLDTPEDFVDFARILQLPLVLKFEKRGETSYYIVDNASSVYGDSAYPRGFPPTIVKYRRLHFLARKHGRPLAAEEFERGAIAPTFAEGRNREGFMVGEYRFQATA